MASDFNKIMYHAVEDHIKATMGPDEFKKFDKVQWRKLMDIAMTQFAGSMVSVIASVARNQYEAKQKADAAAAALKATETPVAPVDPVLSPSSAGE